MDKAKYYFKKKVDVAVRKCKLKGSDLQLSGMYMERFSIDIQSNCGVTYEEISSIKWHQQQSTLISPL